VMELVYMYIESLKTPGCQGRQGKSEVDGRAHVRGEENRRPAPGLFQGRELRFGEPGGPGHEGLAGPGAGGGENAGGRRRDLEALEPDSPPRGNQGASLELP